MGKKANVVMFMLSLFLLSGCITVVKEGEEGKLTGESAFNAGDNVAEIWEDEALPNLKEKAIDLKTFLAEANNDLHSLAEKYGSYSMGSSGELSYTVKGVFKVIEVVTDKKAGYMLCEIAGYAGPIVIKIQIGSVFKGSSVRDSLDFIKFEDYKNQVDYAAVSQSINDLIQKELLDNFDLTSLQGKEIKVVGCFTVSDPNEILIMPVTMEEK
ncbi:MAG: DUF2291 domain-containing protein [Breznakia sp.]